MPTVPASGRADMTDAQWAVLEPQLPRGKKPGRPRNAVDCGIARLKRNRAVVTRYDKLAVRYEATVHIAAINEWLLPSLLNRP